MTIYQLTGTATTSNGVLKTFWKDFWGQVDTWLEQGEQLIVAGDWNDNIYKSKLTKQFKVTIHVTEELCLF